MPRVRPRFVIGVDEAGYGPNLGPLVITAISFARSHEGDEADWQDRFRRKWRDASETPVPLPAIDDSKRVYGSGRSLGPLETVALAVVTLAQERTSSSSGEWRSAPSGRCEVPSSLERLCAALRASPSWPPWHQSSPMALPLEAPSDHVAAATEAWTEAERASGIRLVSVRSRVIFPMEWNAGLAREPNKASLLSSLSLGLVKEAAAALPAEGDIYVACDKHGGRQHYLRFLVEIWPGALLDVEWERPESSRYRTRVDGRLAVIEFRKGGESELPVALASMVSKYVREVAMAEFNAFWRRHLPDVRPTAGYPVDAARFRRETEDIRRALGITDDVFWRTK